MGKFRPQLTLSPYPRLGCHLSFRQHLLLLLICSLYLQLAGSFDGLGPLLGWPLPWGFRLRTRWNIGVCFSINRKLAECSQWVSSLLLFVGPLFVVFPPLEWWRRCRLFKGATKFSSLLLLVGPLFLVFPPLEWW